MAITWLAHTGWEAGPATEDATRSFQVQHLWALGASFTNGVIQDEDDSGVVPGAGRFAYEWPPNDLAQSYFTTGQIHAASERYRVYGGWHRVNGWLTSGNLVVDDQYTIMRFSTGHAPGGSDHYYALGLRIVSIPPATVAYRYILQEFADDGTFEAWQDGDNNFDVETNHYVVVHVDNDDSANPVLNLWVDGTQETADGDADWTPGGTGIHEEFLPCSSFTAGKGSSAGIKSIFDDWASGESDTASDRPPSTTGVVAYQPTGDVLVQWTPTGDTTNHWRNLDDLYDDCPEVGDKETPTDTGQADYFAYKDEAGSPAGTVQGAALVWRMARGASDYHDAKARITTDGGSWIALTAPGYGNSADSVVSVGTHMKETPETVPAAWTTADFNNLEGGLYSGGTDYVMELYAMAIGTGLNRPAYTECPPAVARRIFIT